MSQLNIKMGQAEIDALRRLAAKRRTPVSWLVKDYVNYLIAGGPPVTPPATEAPTAAELAMLAQKGGSLDWLADEPEFYTLADGEPL